MHFGGAQLPMQETTILTSEGFLGPFASKLEVGDVQSMVFDRPTNVGPWYLSSEEREKRRHNQSTDKANERSGPKTLLVDALESLGVILQKQRNHTKKELQKFARNNGVDLHYEKTEIIHGWEGQPKGLLQVLWEQGLMSDSKEQLVCYIINGRKDPITGVVHTNSSLRHLLAAKCVDLREQETALQQLGAQLGVTVVLLTPKFHAELAGEGVEYCWAHAKLYYRRKPVSLKRGRENFKILVKDCTCTSEILTRERAQKFAARARAYICTYYHLDQQSADIVDGTALAQKQELLFTKIERLMMD
jgi:hypothetical protein